MKKIKTIFLSKKNLKRDLIITVLFIFSAFSFVKAGNFNSPGTPVSTGYTLEDIYQRLTTNSVSVEADHNFFPASDPGSPFASLTQLYESIPTIAPETVKLGTNYLGINGNLTPDGGTSTANDFFFGKTAQLTGDWDLDTGTLRLACATDTFDGSDNKVSDSYDGNGNGNNRWCIGDSGDALADEIISGKKAWIDGVEISGNMDNIGAQMITPAIDDKIISQGFHNGSGVVAGDADLNAYNIRSGVNIFGVNGNSMVVNTDSGTAQANNILAGKIAWVDGNEITGMLANIGQQIITPSASSHTITQGYHSGTGQVDGDADLVANNIKGGVNIFNVIGNFVSQEKTGTNQGQEITPDSGKWLSKVTLAIANLVKGNIKKGVTVGGVNGELESGYPGSGWVPNSSGDASQELNENNCNSASNWEWFQDGNGDGDTSDPEDGICVRTDTVNSDSWNGAEQVTPNNLGPVTASGGSANSITVAGASWTANAYKNHVVKIKTGTASNCWARAKSNDNNTITIYGSWLSTAYASNCGVPNSSSSFIVSDDWGQYDNSFIGDYSCSGDYPNGTVVYGNYPSSGTIALAVADCYDGRRDLLPREEDRAVITGNATGANDTSLTDSAQSLDANTWVGQKILITNGTGAGSWGIIESNTSTQIVVADWLSGVDPSTNSQFKVIYIVPQASYNPDAQVDGDNDDAKANNGPLMAQHLAIWNGTRLPTASDFIGFCGYKDGGSNYENSTGANSADKSYGNHGGQAGRTDEFMDLNNSTWEWLSEQRSDHNARIAGVNACSYFVGNSVTSGYRFRAVFRP